MALSAEAPPSSAPVQTDDVLQTPEAQSAFCATLQESSAELRRRAHGESRDAQIDLISSYRVKVDKCDREQMRSPPVCRIFVEFPEAAAEAFAPVYGGYWDGWGRWIKEECIMSLLTPEDAAHQARVRGAYEQAVRGLSRVVPFEYSGSARHPEEAAARGILLDALNGVPTPNGSSDLERELRLVEPRVPSVRSRLERAKHDISPHRAVLVEARCKLASARGEPSGAGDCAHLIDAAIDATATAYLLYARDENYNGTPRDLLR